ATDFFKNHGAYVVEIPQQADAPHEENLRTLGKNAAACVRIVSRKSLADVVDGDAVVAHLYGVDERLVLLYIAAGRVDLGDSRNRAAQRPRHPILNRAALHEFGFTERTFAIFRMVNRVLVDLAQRRRYGTEHRCDAFGKVRFDVAEPLRYQLARKILWRLVVE